MPGGAAIAVPTLLLTRPRDQSLRVALAFRAAGGQGPILISPMLRIAPVPGLTALPDGPLIFTSENGVRAAMALGTLAGRRCYAVGPRTGAIARAAGAACADAGGDARSLRALIARDRPAGPLHHLRGSHVAGDLAAGLAADGVAVESHVVYDQRSQPLTDAARRALGSERPVILPLYSPRTARLVGDALDAPPRRTRVVALSPAVAGAWRWPGPVTVAERPDGAAMDACLAGLVAGGAER